MSIAVGLVAVLSMFGTGYLHGLVATSEPFQHGDVHFQLNNSSLALPLTPLTTSSFGTWPMYDQNSLRTGSNVLERTLAPGNVSLLSLASHFPVTTFGPIAGSAAVANGTAYFGTMAGNLYALNVTTGTVQYDPALSNTSWIANTSSTVAVGCSSQPSGIISTPAIWNNLAIVATGDSISRHGYGWVRAYNISGLGHGGQPLWAVNLTSSVSSAWYGAYTWSSPVVWNGDVYIGLASGCDHPLVQGALFQLNATTGAILHLADMVPATQDGASIWSSPSIDATDDSIWVTTGNNNGSLDQPLSSSIVELNLSNVSQVLGHWEVPSVSGLDKDFGAGATLVSGGSNLPLAIATNKNGVVYALNRTDLIAGPVWQDTLANSGAVTPAASGNGLVYVAGGPVQLTYVYSGLPPGCTSRNTSQLVCVPSPQSSGLYRVTIRGIDAAGKVGFANTSITVAPTSAFQVNQFITDHDAGVSKDSQFSLNTVVNNSVGSVSFTYTGLPPGCVSQNVPKLFCTPNTTGVYSIDVFANDSVGHHAEAILTQGVTSQGAEVNVLSGFAKTSSVAVGTATVINVSMRTQLVEGPGSIDALYPSNGTVEWSHSSPGTFYAGPSYANGLVIDAAIWPNCTWTSLEILSATSGKLLAQFNVSGMVTGEPVVADGRIYFGTTPSDFTGSGKFYALNIPLTAQLWAAFNNNALGLTSGPIISFAGTPPLVAIGGSPPYNCLWDFGDHSESPSCHYLTHQYTQPGQYTMTLNVSDQVGASSTASTKLFTSFSGCSGGTLPCPIWGSGGLFTLAPCSLGSPLQCIQPRTVSFDSYESGGAPPYSYLWSFGDGHTSTDQYPTYTYAQSGQYSVMLTVTDSQNHQYTLSFAVSVS